MMMPSIFKEDLFDEMFSMPFDDDFFGGHNPLYGKHAKNLMKTDVKENDGDYEVAIDLPGFKKEDMNLVLDHGYLIITANKNMDKDEQDQKGRYIRKERYQGSMSRSFYVGEALTEADIRAKYENGILKLCIPKKDEKEIENHKYIAIEG